MKNISLSCSLNKSCIVRRTKKFGPDKLELTRISIQQRCLFLIGNNIRIFLKQFKIVFLSFRKNNILKMIQL